MREYDAFVRKKLIPFFLRRVAAVEGAENIPRLAPFIFAANHTASFDHATLASFFSQHVAEKIYFPTKKKYFEFYRKLNFEERLGMILVEPENPSACLEILLKKLSEGHCVGIFPEGKGHSEARLLKGKTGVARLALRSGFPVLPVGISGGGYGSHIVDWTKIFFERAGTLRIRIGTPIVFTGSVSQDPYTCLRGITDRIMGEIGSLCGRPYTY